LKTNGSGTGPIFGLANICRVLSCTVSSPAQHVARSETAHLLH